MSKHLIQRSPNPAVGSVDASPTKRFFIDVLIKDIDFIDALVELIDNGVDAIRERCRGLKKLTGSVKVEFSSKEIVVEDDGIGISIHKAETSAFKFGRKSSLRNHTVGAFGVGMKRALFKISREFTVKSSTTDELFVVELDVDEWERSGEESAADWTFPMTEKSTGLKNRTTGTRVQMSRLHEYALDDVRSKTFAVRLKDKIQDAHENAIDAGVKISINGEFVESRAPELLKSRSIVPLYTQSNLVVDGESVSVSLYAGVGEAKLADSGWYIFCNGRQIERAEKSKRTGWDTALEEGEATPRPHWQFRRFRGYVFFDSDVPQILPWNTTKTGLNTETAVYRRAKASMTSALREVITFLNAVDAEEDENGPLSVALEKAKPVRLNTLSLNAYFRGPKGEVPVARLARVSFRVDKELLQAVKDELGVVSNPEAGEGVFDHYVKAKKLV